MPFASISEGNFDLRSTPLGAACEYRYEHETPEGRVVGSHLTLALKNMDFNGGLTVSGSGVNLTLLDRHCGVSARSSYVNTPPRVSMPSERGVTSSREGLVTVAENAALNCGTDCNAFIGVDTLEGLFAKEFLDSVLNSRDTR